MIHLIRSKLNIRIVPVSRFQSTKTEQSSKAEEEPFNEPNDDDEDEPNPIDIRMIEEMEESYREKIAYIEKMRDVSRLPKSRLKFKIDKKIQPNISSDAFCLKYENFFRRLYAQHGWQSGIDGGVMWPAKHKLEETIKIEKEYDLTLKEKINILIERKQEELTKHKER
jgi:hypothetical protein